MIAETVINNRYRLSDAVGSGGMGTVYKAYDRLTGDMVALKRVTVPKHQLDLMTNAPPTVQHNAVLANEFSVLASLRHPNIVEVLDYGFDADSQPFFTMELIKQGISIKELARGKSRTEKIGYLFDILQALRYLHQRGILHRDLKPANIIVSDDVVRLLDFGLAVDAQVSKTQGDAAGTLAYIAPEVLGGQPPSPQSDLYAFGVIAYQILSGHYPFVYETQTELIQQLLMAYPQFDHWDDDDKLVPVIQRLLSKDPTERYATALDVLRAISSAADMPLPIETSAIRESFLVASTFVGRESELKILNEGLDKALSGETQTFLIGGESGIGKSRLMSELRTQALVKGFTVVRGQAITEIGKPYKIWREILPHLLLMVDVSDSHASFLQAILPNISQLLERDILARHVNDQEISAQLPLVLSHILINAAKKSPILILFEDLQWSNASLDVLKLVMASLNSERVMIVGNYRNDEAPQLADGLNAMQYLILNRLDESQMMQLSTAMLGESGSNAGVVDLIRRETEGNVFFVVEVVRALAEEVGQLSMIGQTTLPAQVFTGGIQRVIGRRMENLPEWALAPLQVSSIIGREINPTLVKQILPDVDIESWLYICNAVAVISGAGDSWQFTHDKIREYVLASLDETTTINLNRQVAQALETVYADNIEQYAADISDYYLAAHERKEAGQYASIAANTLRTFDPIRAYSLAKRALSLEAHTYHEQPEHELARLKHLLGRTAMSLSKYEESGEALNQALTLFTEIDDEFGVAQVKVNLGELGYKRREFEGTVDLLEESLPVLLKYNDLYEIGSAYLHLGIVHWFGGDQEQVIPYFQKALETMQEIGDEVEIAKAYNNLGIANETQGDFEQGMVYHQKALEIRRRLHDRRGIASSLSNIATLEFERGNLELAKELYEEGIEYMRATANQSQLLRALASLAEIEYQFKNVRLAISYMQESIDIASNLGENFSLALNQATMSRFVRATDATQARQLVMSSLALSKEFDNPMPRVTAINAATQFLNEQGMIDLETQTEWLAAAVKHETNGSAYKDVLEQLEELQVLLDPYPYNQAFERGRDQNLTAVIDKILDKLTEKEA